MKKVTITDIKKNALISFLKKIQAINIANVESNPSSKDVIHFKYDDGMLESDCMHRHDMFKRVLTETSEIGLLNFHNSPTEGFITVINDGKLFLDYVSKRSDKMYLELSIADKGFVLYINVCDNDGSKKKFACKDDSYYIPNDMWDSQVSENNVLGSYTLKKDVILKFKDGLRKTDIETDIDGGDYKFAASDTLCIYVEDGVLKGRNLYYEGILSTDMNINEAHFIANEKLFLLDGNTDYNVKLIEEDTYGRRMLFEEIEGDKTRTIVICANVFDPDQIDYNSFN